RPAVRRRAAWTVILAAQLANLAGEFRASAVDPRLDRALREPEACGDFLVRQLLQVTHDDRRAQGVGLVGERLAEQRHAIALLERGYRADLAGRGCQLVRIDVAVDGFALL